jgi:chaperone required for assembly of F1-ATPase
MKRFWKQAAIVEADDGWRVLLDGRAIRTVGGRAQVVPTQALAAALAEEWAAQGEEIDARLFVYRDMADFALDVVGQDRAGQIDDLLRYAETDTLCYRGDPGEALTERQDAVWEPLLTAAEHRYEMHFERVAGVLHKPQPEATLRRLRAVLEAQDDFTLAALKQLASLAASLTLALAALEPGADTAALWDAANLEEDWQAELWGKDGEAMERRARRLAAFAAAARFAALARA